MQAKRINAIVVDDEKLSREVLTTYITDFCEGVDIVAECDSVKTAFKAISDSRPQLVFLDIEMPNGNGFELLKLYKTLPFKVIFVTAFSEFAIRAFRFSATDYLLKPVKVDELVEAVNKVRHELEHNQSGQNIQVLLESLTNHNGEINQIIVPDNKGFTVIKLDEIIMCEADGYCTYFLLIGKRKVCSTKSIKHFEDIFNNQQIIRVHRSYLVNRLKVKGYTKQGEIMLEENLNCPLGNNYRQQFLNKIGG